MLTSPVSGASSGGVTSQAKCRPLVRKLFDAFMCPAVLGEKSRLFDCLAVCGPSGAGKSTLISMLRKEFPADYGFSVSHTTRDPRPGEKDGVDYHFVPKAVMEADMAEGKFLETAHVHGNFYGTSFKAVNEVASQNRICILDIDIQARCTLHVGRHSRTDMR